MIENIISFSTALQSKLPTFFGFQPSWDLFIVLFFIFISLIYGLSLGRDRILVILISIYTSYAIVSYLPFLIPNPESISLNDQFALRITFFLIVFILLFFFLSNSVMHHSFTSFSFRRSVFQSILFSVLHVGLLISITLSFFPSELTHVLSPFTQSVFLGNIAKSFWMLSPIVFMTIFGKTRTHEEW